MALIFRVSSEQTAPEWYKNEGLPTPPSVGVSEEDITRIASLPKDLDEDALTKELDVIEASGKNGGIYYYSSSWSQDVKQTIREYAIVSNCRVEEVDPSDENIQAFASMQTKENGLLKTASVASPEVKRQIDFSLDAPFASEKNEAPINEGLKGLAKARTGMPAIEARGTTISRAYSSTDDDTAGLGMRAGYGRNVIQNPNSIGSAIEEKNEDVGVRLRREREEREQARKAEINAEQKKLAMEMKNSGYGALKTGSFNISETAPVQGGVARRVNRELPEFTDGEKIVVARKEKEQAVTKKKEAARKQWDVLEGSNKPVISDELANALKAEIDRLT